MIPRNLVSVKERKDVVISLFLARALVIELSVSINVAIGISITIISG